MEEGRGEDTKNIIGYFSRSSLAARRPWRRCRRAGARTPRRLSLPNPRDLTGDNDSITYCKTHNNVEIIFQDRWLGCYAVAVEIFKNVCWKHHRQHISA